MLYSKLSSIYKTRKASTGNEVVLPEGVFILLLHAALLSVTFDETWYLEQNPDVRESVQSGRLRSARDHFVMQGYFEGRLPHPIAVDEKYYSNANPDVREALDRGAINSLKQHFMETGRFEGRTPYADFSLFPVRHNEPANG
jgi:hypothetical protein